MAWAETGAQDPEYIENFDVPKESELKKIKDHKQSLSIVTLESGHKLIIRNDSEILVPRKAREKMCRTLHFTHHSEEMMMKQAKDKVFWPSMRGELRNVYDTCKERRVNCPSKAKEHNEVSQQNLFDSYLPGQHMLIDYAISGHTNFDRINKVLQNKQSEQEWSSALYEGMGGVVWHAVRN